MITDKPKYEYIIKPAKHFTLNFKEIWEYRELFFFFTWRDIKVKYKQTILGFLWAVIQPFIMMLVFSMFTKVLNVPHDNIPRPIFIFSGLLLWNIFANGLVNAGSSMVANANMIKKIYFPRLIIPMSAILVAFFDFIMAFIVYIGILIYFQFEVSIIKLLVYLPVSVLMTILTAFGLGSLLAALNVKYRDVRYVIPFMVQLLLFLTPVIYPISIFENPVLRTILNINPMAGAINLLRSALIQAPMQWDLFAISAASTVMFFILGVYVFRRTESYFADLA